MLWWMLAACGPGVHALYDAERAAVLAVPPEAAAQWEPELRVRLSDDALQRLATAALEAGLLAADDELRVDGPFGLTASVRPKAAVSALTVAASRRCDACVDLDVTLDGEAGWALGPAKGELQFTATTSGTVAFAVEADSAAGAHAFVASGKLQSLDRVRVKAGKAGDFAVGQDLERWTSALAARVPAIPLGRFGGDDLPLRALRVRTTGGAIAVEGLTDAAGGAPLTTAPSGVPTDDWELSLSQPTALALLRRAAFQKGTVAFDVAIDPRGLAVDGDRFTLDLRLWRLAGRGWWRDYQVEGAVDVQGNKARLNPESASEGEKSKGAGLADPLALLAEGRILEAVERGVAQNMPSSHTLRTGALKLDARAGAVRGEGGALIVTGELDAGEQAPKKRTHR